MIAQYSEYITFINLLVMSRRASNADLSSLKTSKAGGFGILIANNWRFY